MEKSTFTPLYEAFRVKLVALRKAAGMTQRDLAAKVGRERSFVARIELGERRLDVVEFHWICRALRADPEKTAAEIMRAFRAIDRRPAHKAARPQSSMPDPS